MLFQVEAFIDKETDERNDHYEKNMDRLMAFEPLFELPQELVASSAHEKQMKANSASPSDAGSKGKRRRRNTDDDDL